jgi:hypothetical protein
MRKDQVLDSVAEGVVHRLAPMPDTGFVFVNHKRAEWLRGRIESGAGKRQPIGASFLRQSQFLLLCFRNKIKRMVGHDNSVTKTVSWAAAAFSLGSTHYPYNFMSCAKRSILRQLKN